MARIESCTYISPMGGGRARPAGARRMRGIGAACGGVGRRSLSTGAARTRASVASVVRDRRLLPSRPGPTPCVRQQRERIGRPGRDSAALGRRPRQLGAGHRGPSGLAPGGSGAAAAVRCRCGRRGGRRGQGPASDDSTATRAEAHGGRLVPHQTASPGPRLRRDRTRASALRRDPHGHRVVEARAPAAEVPPSIGRGHRQGTFERCPTSRRRHTAGKAASAPLSLPPLLTSPRPL
jgi:hypothetical protein